MRQPSELSLHKEVDFRINIFILRFSSGCCSWRWSVAFKLKGNVFIVDCRESLTQLEQTAEKSVCINHVCSLLFFLSPAVPLCSGHHNSLERCAIDKLLSDFSGDLRWLYGVLVDSC